VNDLTRFLNRYRRRTWLLALVVLLLLLKLGSFLLGDYRERIATLESRQATLRQYRNLTADADELRDRLARLRERREKLVTHLFSGAKEGEIVSAMQLNLQALVSTAGLQSESLRPIPQKSARGSEGEQERTGLGEVAVNARLAGSLAEALEFLTLLAQSGKFFKIESMNLSPYKRTGLKIALELRGYFVTIPPANDGGSGEEAESASPAG
jgi:hypothetical protein